MRVLFKSKDGGPESNVTGYWLIEWKSVFSIVLLRFDKGTREAYNSHAFDAVSWIIKGNLLEMYNDGTKISSQHLLPSMLPIFTGRNRLHKVYGIADCTWALSFRGPWASKWIEWFEDKNKTVTLTHGRKVLD